MKWTLFPKKRAIVFSLVMISISLWSTEAISCGDKFLVVGRGIRYERVHASKYPSSILVFAVDTESRSEFQSILKKAGHQVRAVGSEPQLDKVLNSGDVDLALVNLSDLMMVEDQIKSSPSKPFILPYIYQSGGEVMPPAEYSCILKSENKRTDVLRTIDAIMESQAKGKALNCKKILK